MKILAFNFNNILTDVIEELKKRGHEILPYDGKKSTFNKAEVVVTWNETALGGFRDVIERAKRKGMRTILVQHGRRGTSRIYPPFNETLLCDIACVWSENDKKRLMSVGVPEDKIKITGTEIWRHLKPRVEHKEKNVVFSPEHWSEDVSENLIVADKLRKLKGVNIITKILKNHQIESLYDNVVISERNSSDHFSIVADVLSKADVVVAISESTFELLAQALDIPVVIADCWIPKACDGDERYKEYKHQYSDACVLAPLDKLNDEIMRQLKNPGLLREQRKKIIEDDGGYSIENPIANIIEVIENNGI